MNRVENVYSNARNKSTKKYIKISYKGETIKVNKKKLKQLAIKAAVSVIVLIAIFKMGAAAVEKIDHALDVRRISTYQAMEANSILAENDLHVVPFEGEWNNNYCQIKDLSEQDLYGFVKYCGYAEAEKVLGALGYESWNNYLSMKGYFDKDGKPSRLVWENYEETRLINEEKGAKENGRNY